MPEIREQSCRKIIKVEGAGINPLMTHFLVIMIAVRWCCAWTTSPAAKTSENIWSIQFWLGALNVDRRSGCIVQYPWQVSDKFKFGLETTPNLDMLQRLNQDGVALRYP